MEIRKGTSRIAFVGKHFTCKVPNPTTFCDLTEIFRLLRSKNIKGLYRWLQYTEGNRHGLRWVMSGFLQNWREFKLSKELGDMVVPTRLSLFGLLSIQDTAYDLSAISDDELFKSLRRAIGPEIMRDSHTFSNRNNFGIHGDRAKIRDYGGVKTVPILRKHRNSIDLALKSLATETK